MDSKDWSKLAIEAMGYEDLHGKMRAATLMKLTQKNLWKEAASEVKSKYQKEIKVAIANLKGPWNPSIDPSHAAVADQVKKILQAHEIYPYPELVHAILGDNSYQERWTVPDYVGDQPDATKVKAADHLEMSAFDKVMEHLGSGNFESDMKAIGHKIDSVSDNGVQVTTPDGKKMVITVNVHEAGNPEY